MSDTNDTPTAEQLRDARHSGFSDSIKHMPEADRGRITTSYTAQDARRSDNINTFCETVKGGGS